MRGSFRIATLAGIGVYVHWTFGLLVAYVVMATRGDGAGWREVLFSVGFLLTVFLCVVLHELGHALAARRFGISTRDITLLPIGGVARLERMPRNPWQEIVVAVAGPAVNVVIAAGLSAWLIPTIGIRGLFAPPTMTSYFAVNVLMLNGIMILFNMLPSFPMDGGRVLRALLAMWIGFLPATRIAAKVGALMAMLFLGAALFGLASPMLAFVAMFVYLAGQQELRMAEMLQGGRHQRRQVVLPSEFIVPSEFSPHDDGPLPVWERPSTDRVHSLPPDHESNQ